jgi:hypothetical protein
MAGRQRPIVGRQRPLTGRHKSPAHSRKSAVPTVEYVAQTAEFGAHLRMNGALKWWTRNVQGKTQAVSANRRVEEINFNPAE